MAVQRTRRRELAGDLCRDPEHASSVEGSSEQDGPQRCAWHRADDAGGALSPCACEDVTQSETADAADPSQLLQSKAIAVDNDLRGTLRNFGLKVGMVGAARFEARIKELIENFPDLAVLVEPLLVVRRVLREQIVILHRRLLAIVREDEVCRRLMTTPGVGPVVALAY